MRNLVRNFILVLVVAIGSTSMLLASVVDPVISVVSIDNAKAIDLHLRNTAKKNFVVEIKDQFGEILLTRKMKNNSENISQRYNLKNLPDGVYYISISNDLQKTIQTIQIADNQVIVKEDNSKKYYRPTISVTETSLDVNMLLLDNRASLIIQDKIGDIAYATSFENESSINKRFNLSDLPKGDYTIIIRTEEQTFTEDIEL